MIEYTGRPSAELDGQEHRLDGRRAPLTWGGLQMQRYVACHSTTLNRNLDRPSTNSLVSLHDDVPRANSDEQRVPPPAAVCNSIG